MNGVTEPRRHNERRKDMSEMMEPTHSVDAGPATRASAAARGIEPLAAGRIAAARQSFVTRRVDLAAARALITSATPGAGDLVLARVQNLGHHKRLQLPTGRRARLFPGDEIIVAYGDRYAPQQFEALVPRSLGPCHLVASGGVAAHALTWHSQIQAPTEIEPIGLLVSQSGRRLNLRDWGLGQRPSGRRPPVVVAVAGTAMDAGKTTAGAHLVRGIRRAGLSVGTAKVTGTGACNDFDWMRDAGAGVVLDFTDAGYVSTHRLGTPVLVNIAATLLDQLAAAAVDVALLEIADGLAQPETAALLESDWALAAIDAVMFCAGDALGASAGLEWLARRRHRVLCVSGLLTAAPLAIRETEMLAPGTPVLDLAALSDPLTAQRLVASLRTAAA